MKTLRTLGALALLFSLAAFGAAPSTTTLAGAINADQTQLQLASITGLSVGDELYIDGEAMRTYAITGTLVSVNRGMDNTRQAGHAAGTSVSYGKVALFTTNPPARGTCDATVWTDTLVDVRNGDTYVCSGGSWQRTQNVAGTLNVGAGVPGQGVVISPTAGLSNLPTWRRMGTVISAGITGEQTAVQEPTVIYDTNPQLAGFSGQPYVFKMWYTGGFSAPNIMYAESLDGMTWSKQGIVLAGYWRSCVIKQGSTYYLYGVPGTGTNIDVFTSSDGTTWTLAGTSVVAFGQGSWDATSLANSWVWVEGGSWKMLYEAAGGGVYSIGLATSSDGLTWSRFAENPVITNSPGSVSGPWVTKISGNYWMWGHTSTSGAAPTDAARYVSTDLIHWTRNPAPSIFPRISPDEGPRLASGQVADLTLLELNGQTYMWYDATDDVSHHHIKLAIAPMTLADLVQTIEGALGGDGGGAEAGRNTSITDLPNLATFSATGTGVVATNSGGLNIGGATDLTTLQGGWQAIPPTTGMGVQVRPPATDRDAALMLSATGSRYARLFMETPSSSLHHRVIELRTGGDALDLVQENEADGGLYQTLLHIDTLYNKLSVPGAVRTPASTTDPCRAGEFAFDGSYAYFCVDTNTWKRAAIATW